jgi:signal transduction histidine kinase
MEWKSANVLLVDPDDSFAARVGRAFAKTSGCATFSRAHTLAEARAVIAANSQDVVLTVLSPPDGTATDLLTTNGSKSDFPVVVLAESGEETTAAAAVEMGAIDCYVKPGTDVSDLPAFALRCAREWMHVVDRERAEKTIVQLRAQVHQFRRLVASGLMARAVARDMENLLDPILGYAEMALTKIPPRGHARGEIEHVVRVARMAKELVCDALTGSVGGEAAGKMVDAAHVIEDVLGTLRPLAPPGVEVRAGKSAAGALVSMEASRLHRVITNLCLNAFDAMQSSGGVLQVDLEIADADSPAPPQGSYARLMVTDTGHGMDKDVARKVFDPFFTTASRDERAGLGLFVVREIVESNGGSVIVDSEPGKGTVFQLLLPCVEEAAAGNSLRRY